ncbi:MAG: phosphoethanolamine--lipid A transferase [Helicobacter sp.]|nr:phosphoethanolamine--lipid A transferase [Helicobacter sp.]
MKFFTLSWLKFTLLCALLLTAFNFLLFDYIYQKVNFFEIFYFVCIYFLALVVIFSLIFIPYCTKILMSLLYLMTCISVYFMMNFGIVIDSEMIRNIISTNAKEAMELFNFKMIAFIFCLGIVPSFLLWFIKIDYGSLKSHLKVKISLFFGSLGIFLLVFFAFSQSLMPFVRNYKEVRVYNVPFYPLYSLGKFFFKEYSLPKDFEVIAQDASLDESAESSLMILVIGETARSANYSLGGYQGNLTNPYTQNLEGLLYFEGSSCGTSTAVSLPCMFSPSSREHFNLNQYQENVLDVLQRVGVNVAWYGNNYGGCKGVCDRLEEVKMIQAPYDEVLLESVASKMQNLTKYNLIVLHLQGSHGPAYYKRYPGNFKKFLPICQTNQLQECSKESIINTYDNTLLYTDFLLSELITMLLQSQHSKKALFYLSDHGESLGEYGIYLHGMPYGLAPLFQTTIPIILWSNNANLKNNKSFNLSHDNVFHSLLGFFDVQTQDYSKEMDIFNIFRTP